MDHEEIQESSNKGTLKDISAQPEDETPIEPIEDLLPVRRSSRVSNYTNIMWFPYNVRW